MGETASAGCRGGRCSYSYSYSYSANFDVLSEVKCGCRYGCGSGGEKGKMKREAEVMYGGAEGRVSDS